MVLRNARQAAGRSRAHGRAPPGETFLGDGSAIFRRQEGSPAARQDACPHRGRSLGGSGAGVAAPTGPGALPPRARSRSSRVVDRSRLLRVRTGEPAEADPDPIFPVARRGDPTRGLTGGGGLPTGRNRLRIADDLLDPSRTRGRMPLPAIAPNRSVHAPAGAGGPGRAPDPPGCLDVPGHVMTPIAADRARNRRFPNRDTGPGDAGIGRRRTAGARTGFEGLGRGPRAKLLRRHLPRLIEAGRTETAA